MTRLAPVLFVLLWSTGFIGARMGAPYSEPLTFLSIRFALVLALMAAILAVRRTPLPGAAIAGHCIVVGILIHGIYLGGVFWSIDRGLPAGIAALIAGLQPLLTAIIAGTFLDERIGPRHWAGLIVGVAGLILVLAPKLNVADQGIDLITVTPTIVATIALTVGTIYQKRFAGNVDLFAGGMLQYVGAALVVGLGALFLENFEITWTGEFVFALAWLILVLSIGAVSLLMLLIRAGAVSRVASLFYLVPAATTLIAWALFGETLNAVQLAGMAIIALAVALVARSR